MGGKFRSISLLCVEPLDQMIMLVFIAIFGFYSFISSFRSHFAPVPVSSTNIFVDDETQKGNNLPYSYDGEDESERITVQSVLCVC